MPQEQCDHPDNFHHHANDHQCGVNVVGRADGDLLRGTETAHMNSRSASRESLDQSCVRTSLPIFMSSTRGPSRRPLASLGSTRSTVMYPRKSPASRSMTLKTMPLVTCSFAPTEMVAYFTP